MPPDIIHTLECVAGVLRYSVDRELLWELLVAHVAVVGEFTVPAWGDDYFLVFLDRTGGWFQASFYAAGRDTAFQRLSEELNAPLAFGLCNSVELRSRVIWPPSLLDSPLLAETPLPPRHVLQRVLRTLGLGRYEFPLSDAVLSFLGIGPLARR